MSSAFDRLYKSVWCNRHLKKYTKIGVYRAIIFAILLYGSELYVTYCHHLWLLEWFHQCCLCTILNIHWSDFIINIQVFEQLKITNIKTMLQKSPLHWLGHISTMRSHCSVNFPLVIVTEGHQGSNTKTTWKFLGACHINHI